MSEAANLEEALVSVGASVAAATNALEAGQALGLSELHSTSCSTYRNALPTSAVPPEVRKAAVALAHEFQRANRVITSQLLPEPCPTCNWEPYLAVLQTLVLRFMDVWEMVPQGDPDLAFRILAAGVIVVEAGSLAQITGSAADTHCFALAGMLRRLDHMSTIGEGHSQALAVLRATTFRPEALLAALRRALLGQAPTAMDKAGVWINYCMNFILSKKSCFTADRAAIEADMELQAGIVASLDGSIRHIARLSGTSSIDKRNLALACTAIRHLTAPSLKAAARARAPSDRTDVICMLSACLDIILEIPLVEVDQEVEGSQLNFLSTWSWAVADAFGFDDDINGWEPSLTDSLDCIKRGAAAAVATITLQQPESDQVCVKNAIEGLYELMRSIPALYQWPGTGGTAAVAAAVEPTDAARSALLLSALTALESITRLAALLPASLQLPGLSDQDLIAVYHDAAEFTMDSVLLTLPEGHSRLSVALSQAVMPALAGVVESVGKLALITAGGAGMPQSVRLDSNTLEFERLHVLVGSCANIIRIMMPSMAIPAERGEDTVSMRRWRGVALAASSTAVALAGSEGQPLDILPAFQLLPLSLLTVPGVCDLLPAVPDGRSAVHQALANLPVFGSDTSLHEDEGIHGLLRAILGSCKSNSRADAALALARLGALTQLASWGEVQCGSRSLDDCLESLQLLRVLVERAVHSSDMAEAQAAYELIGERPADVSTAAYWRRLRTEVTEPLAAALEAKAAAALDPAQLAVDIAEAQATRTCAYVKCTTVVRASEAAAPRGKRCGGCRLVRYCSAACQKADWPAHKAACRELLRRRSADS